MSITCPIIAMPHQMIEYKQIRHPLRIVLQKCIITKEITFHFGMDFKLWVSGYMTGPPGSAVEFGPYNISNRVLYTWKLLLLWAVGLWVKILKKNCHLNHHSLNINHETRLLRLFVYASFSISDKYRSRAYGLCPNRDKDCGQISFTKEV